MALASRHHYSRGFAQLARGAAIAGRRQQGVLLEPSSLGAPGGDVSHQRQQLSPNSLERGLSVMLLDLCRRMAGSDRAIAFDEGELVNVVPRV